ncbi:hypothetical protein CASFOL_033910 [Castilleja foliolosa]|uniref:RING-type domain-containing protein n=1 Tax=Castilleja foliolosa TaxID=1961234 RepID=A0ABD3BYX6_9LAMI
MNENEHHIDNGYNYQSASESFMGFFGGVAAAPYQYSNMAPMHDQESQYWAMHMNSYKYGVSGQESTYYGVYENVDHGQRMDFSRRAWEYPSVTSNVDVHTSVDVPSEQSVVVQTEDNSIPEERSPDQEDAGNAQVLLDDDDIDPDTMTYEELLDLGEAVGTQSRGLSQELINQLPISKHKSGGIFSRRKSEDRCVICQMRYKRGDRQINLPCKHAYHTDCGSKWLSINKTCPVCNTEVFGDESSH